MFREAAESGTAVQRQLAANRAAMREFAASQRARAPRVVITSARGSSDHAATYARYLLETRCGVLTASAAPSVSSVYAATPGLRDALWLAISQSGRSPDLVAAARAARDGGATVVAFVNAEDSPLAGCAHRVFGLQAGPERSVAATKSHVAALAAVLHLAAEWSGDAALASALDALPQDLDRAWALDWSAAADALAGARSLYVLGRGLGLATAQEAALKFKETCGIHAEGLSAAELRHGPMALVEAGFPVLLFAQDDETRDGNAALAAQLVALGAALTVAGLDTPGARVLPALPAHPAVQPLLLVQGCYRLAEALARLRGLDPDRPPRLAKVTETV